MAIVIYKKDLQGYHKSFVSANIFKICLILNLSSLNFSGFLKLRKKVVTENVVQDIKILPFLPTQFLADNGVWFLFLWVKS